MDKSKCINELNNLLTRTYDAEAGYKDAAANSQNANLASMFKNNAEQRYNFGHEIKECIKHLGGKPDKGQSIEGKIHQTWMDIRSSVASNDDLAVLKEVDRGEANALETYNEVLANLPKDLPGYDRIDAQKRQIETLQGQVKGLINNFAKS